MPTAPKVYYDADHSDAGGDFGEASPENGDLHPEYEEHFSQDDENTGFVVRVLEPTIHFAYSLGHQVQPVPEAPARQVIWRGQLKERQADGLVRRVNVYRLNDGFWDCYREDELRVA